MSCFFLAMSYSIFAASSWRWYWMLGPENHSQQQSMICEAANKGGESVK
jgi:hypothetical protein